MEVPAEFKLQSLLVVVHAAAFLVLAGWCLTRTRDGRWAGLGAAGSLLLGLSFGLLAASTFENIWFASGRIGDALLLRDHAYTILSGAQAIGAVLVLAAFLDRRASSTRT